MALSREDLLRVAELARLKLSADELDRLGPSLSRIVDYVDLLNELDTAEVEPLVHAIPLTNVFRDDLHNESLPRDQALLNAPKTDGRFFLVPQILEGA